MTTAEATDWERAIKSYDAAAARLASLRAAMPDYAPPSSIPCRVCKSLYTHFLYPDTSDSKRGNWWRCLSCGCDSSDSVYDELLPRYLDPKYHSHAVDELGSFEKAVECMTTNLDLFGKPFGACRFLDVGASEAAGMEGMERRGWLVHGWDIVDIPSRRPVKFSPAFTANAFDVQFDAILCREVIEHAPDWQALIAEMLAALAPGGLLQIQTPHPWHEPDPLPYQDYHLQIFAPAFLCSWVERFDVEIENLLTWPRGWCAVFRKAPDA